MVRNLLPERIGSRQLLPRDWIVELKPAEEIQVSSIPARETIGEPVAMNRRGFLKHAVGSAPQRTQTAFQEMESGNGFCDKA